MYQNKRIAVVVPAYNEEKQISRVIDTMPDFVDRIIIVNDGSKDQTADVVKKYIDSLEIVPVICRREPFISDDPYDLADVIAEQIRQEEKERYPEYTVYDDQDNKRIVLINEVNSGVGGAISVGYLWCRDHNIDCTAVMAGDAQMDPKELESIIRPVCTEDIDYVKGNRLSHKAAKRMIPKIRHFGNSILSLLTKIASGYWKISDTQTGYTAISLKALNAIAIYDIYRRYGVPNDILIRLNIENCTIREVPIKPVYAIGEKSKMKIVRVIVPISWLLIKGFFRRVCQKYFTKSFHPLFLFYIGGIIMMLVNIPITVKIIINVFIKWGTVTIGTYMLFTVITIFSFLAVGFGMWMDIEDNEGLYK